MNQEEIIEFIRENLRLEIHSERNYTGDMDGSGQLYQTTNVIQLVLGYEVISTVSIG